ncbi:MAG: LemA family protein [Candidatus Riflebacteria bacterium]|nr:LemA family protein [Candidatus Riflebacteria bacterium]
MFDIVSFAAKAKIFFEEHGKLVLAIGTVLFGLAFFVEGVFHYNRLSSWATVVAHYKGNTEKELQRRNNLINQIFRLFNKYSVFEEKMFKSTSNSREWLNKTELSQGLKSVGKDEFNKTLTSLAALAEQYPELKATNLVQDLMTEFTISENRIAGAKEKFNSSVGAYNQCRTTFPGNLYGLILGFKVQEYMGSEDELIKVPQIN